MGEPTPEIEFGDLQGLFEEFKGIIEPLDPNEVVLVPYRPEIVQDNLKKARESLPIDCDQENYAAAIEKAQVAKYSARKTALTRGGFVGSLVGLFQEIIDIAEADQEKVQNINQQLQLYGRIPLEHVKGVGVVTEQGYYWGGKYHTL